MRRGPEALGLGPDGDPPRAASRAVGVEPGWRREALRTWRFWSVSAPFALGLAAQVGVLTHLVGLSAGLVGQPHETLIEEYMALPLKDTVKEKWLYRNAARVFGLE